MSARYKRRTPENNRHELNRASVHIVSLAQLKYTMQLTAVAFVLLVATCLAAGANYKLTTDRHFTLSKKDGSTALSGNLGVRLQGSGTNCAPDESDDVCLQWGKLKLQITNQEDCQNIAWETTEPDQIAVEDCFLFDGHWYGGPEQFSQYWPTEKGNFSDYSYITKQQDNQGIAEPYWVTSTGVYLYVQADTPLFIDQHHDMPNGFCLLAKNKAPYSEERPVLSLRYKVCALENARKAHEHALSTVIAKPSGIPDVRMVRHPIWSTWARYKAPINESIVKQFGNEILENKFENSQLEIDDLWETCYGSLTFDPKKFPDMKALSDDLKAKGFRVTLWVHPFINLDCEPYHSEALGKGYFVKDTTGNTNSVWWNGNGSVIDFTNPEAVSWWSDRLKKMQEENGIDSIKFDAGETSWLPQLPVLSGDLVQQPGIFTTKYVEAVSKFGDIIEVRVGQQTQHLPIFVRMLDKDSKWDFRNGLPTLITTLLQMNMVGYPFVLPDMVGGNGYSTDVVTKELFIRWLQANVFMPSIQYSYVPWDYDEETVQISQKFTKLHAAFTDKIVDLMKAATQDGSPVNPPIWWIDPEDDTAQVIDDEFLLGEDILVAPVVKEGATTRDVYLPNGTWRSELRPDEALYEGRQWLIDYPVALDELAYFTRVE